MFREMTVETVVKLMKMDETDQCSLSKFLPKFEHKV